MQRLGQHFLKNQRALRAMVDALGLTPHDTVIEIGPGHGELTKQIARRIAQRALDVSLIAIEKDPSLAEILRKEFLISNYSNCPKLRIIEGDALTILPELTSTLNPQPYTLCGNIPYYITGYLFRTIGELEHKPARAVFTIQKEVAERICATAPAFNKLAASVQVWAASSIIMALPPEDFEPTPKVESAIIKFKVQSAKCKINEDDLKNYYRMVNILFRQPRKTIVNNLAAGLPELPKETLRAALTAADIAPTDRPQNISVEKIIQFSQSSALAEVFPV